MIVALGERGQYKWKLSGLSHKINLEKKCKNYVFVAPERTFKLTCLKNGDITEIRIIFSSYLNNEVSITFP
jgi:hypothetical protein